jgi:NAD(P)H dehydrogenase (quinone)
LIEAAKAAGVARLVYTSISNGAANPMVLAHDHIATEAALAASGMVHTVLRNNWYTEVYTMALDAVLAHGTMIGAAGEGRVSSAARRDYAAAIAVVASSAGHEGKVYELAGDSAHSGAELAAVLAEASGKPVTYVSLPQEEYAKALEGFGLPPAFAAIMADSDAHVAKGIMHDDSRTLSRLIGRPTTPMAATVAAALYRSDSAVDASSG